MQRFAFNTARLHDKGRRDLPNVIKGIPVTLNFIDPVENREPEGIIFYAKHRGVFVAVDEVGAWPRWVFGNRPELKIGHRNGQNRFFR